MSSTKLNSTASILLHANSVIRRCKGLISKKKIIPSHIALTFLLSLFLSVQKEGENNNKRKMYVSKLIVL